MQSFFSASPRESHVMPSHNKFEYHRNALLQENCINVFSWAQYVVLYVRISIDGKCKYFMLPNLILFYKSPITTPFVFHLSSSILQQTYNKRKYFLNMYSACYFNEDLNLSTIICRHVMVPDCVKSLNLNGAFLLLLK